MTNQNDLAADLKEALEETLAWRRGEITLETREVNPAPSAKVTKTTDLTVQTRTASDV